MPTFTPLHHHAKEANCTPLRQEVTQSHTEDLRDLLHGMHPGRLYLQLKPSVC